MTGTLSYVAEYSIMSGYGSGTLCSGTGFSWVCNLFYVTGIGWACTLCYVTGVGWVAGWGRGNQYGGR